MILLVSGQNHRFPLEYAEEKLAIVSDHPYHRSSTFLPPPPIRINREICPVRACGKPTGGKPYCPEHETVESRRVLPDDMRGVIRSACCDAACMKGPVHEGGEQYCAACKDPCHWKIPLRPGE